MSLLKVVKDQALKVLRPKDYIPEGVLELVRYSRDYQGINFQFEGADGVIIARSTNFRFGSIVTSGKDEKELDANIKDAILTSFEIPSSYASQVKIEEVNAQGLQKVGQVGSESRQYVAA